MSVQCTSQLKQIGLADSTYLNDFNGWLYSPRVKESDGNKTWIALLTDMKYVEPHGDYTNIPESKKVLWSCPEIYPNGLKGGRPDMSYAKRGLRGNGSNGYGVNVNGDAFWTSSGSNFAYRNQESTVSGTVKLSPAEMMTTFDSWQKIGATLWAQFYRATFDSFGMPHFNQGGVLFWDGHSSMNNRKLHDTLQAGRNPRTNIQFMLRE